MKTMGIRQARQARRTAPDGLTVHVPGRLNANRGIMDKDEIMQLKADSIADESVSDVLSKLDTSVEGLTEKDAKSRRAQFGPNEITEEKTHPLLKFLGYFWGPIPWMIEAACILAAVAGRWEDFGVIFSLLAINGGVSYWHERKADKAIQALKDQLAPEAHVLRDGESRKIDARELVPGDVIVVHSGDVVPADTKLLDDQRISVDESALTGESLPVDKEPGDLMYSGTSAKRGKAHAVVVATADKTKFARTVELVESANVESHFRKAVLRIGHFLIISAIVLVLLIVIESLLIHHEPFWTIVLFALGLTLAAIPAALPAVLSVTMSIGASRLARMKAIVSRLSAMDEMAGLDILCADKTGTLTQNKLSLQEPALLEAEDVSEITLVAALTADREEPDPIDQAILDGLENEEALDAYEIEEFRPFDADRKRAEADVSKGNEQFTAAKGAPQAILELVSASAELRKKVSDKVDELAKDGYRALGVARKRSSGGWKYLGLLSLLDPPREDSEEVIQGAQDHGISVRMVTGDHSAIAKQIAEQVGMGTGILEAGETFGDSDEANEDIDRSIHNRVVDADGFAEVTPEHKYRIIKHFQADDHIVGMTGDGVNDAPALKQADVGIAVSGATDAARAAAALVLTAPGLKVIIKAIEEARRIFERMTGYATYRITETIRLLLFITLSVLAFRFYPVTPLMIVLLAILNDIPIMTIAWDNAPLPKRPVRWAMRRVLITSSVLGVVGVVSSFLLYWYIRNRLGLAEEVIRTMMFLKLLVAGHMTLYIVRAVGWFWQRPWPSIPLLLSLEVTQVFGTLAAVYGVLMEPIGWKWAAVVWGYAVIWMFLLDAVKVAVYAAFREFMQLENAARA